MSAFESSSLWTKATMFIDRALAARDNSDAVGYHLWAAVAMEMLGKAALASIHPTLVADPSHIDSLMVAAGRPIGTDRRSISARTVFDRLKLAVPSFDKRMSDECMLMAQRRNAELHSGETPIIGLNVLSWVPHYWRSVEVLVAFQSKTLEDLVGADEASRVREVLRDAAELTSQTVHARIQRRQKELDERFPIGTEERAQAAVRATARPHPSQYLDAADALEESACPACSMKGWLFGSIADEVLTDIHEDAGFDGMPSYYEQVRTTYVVEEFRCPECGLRVEGRDEVAIADLPAEFVREEDRQPDYEPDYGND